MEISQLDLFRLLIHSAIGGIAVGVMYEVLRTFRLVFEICLMPQKVPKPILLGRMSTKLFIPRKVETENGKKRRVSHVLYGIIVFICDIMLAMCAAVTLIIVSYAYNSGRMRWMIFLGFIIGFVIYIITVGRLLKAAIAVVVVCAARLTVKIFKLIGVPVNFIRKIIKSILSKIKTKDKENKRRKDLL